MYKITYSGTNEKPESIGYSVRDTTQNPKITIEYAPPNRMVIDAKNILSLSMDLHRVIKDMGASESQMQSWFNALRMWQNTFEITLRGEDQTLFQIKFPPAIHVREIKVEGVKEETHIFAEGILIVACNFASEAKVTLTLETTVSTMMATVTPLFAIALLVGTLTPVTKELASALLGR